MKQEFTTDWIRGAIFDLDGVILDSMGIWEIIGDRYLLQQGYEPENGLADKLRPMSLIQSAEYLINRYGIKKEPLEIIDGITELLEEFYTGEVQLKPGIAEFVAKLYKAGVKMCITTATERALAETALRRLGLMDVFEFIITCSENGHGKDEPYIYNEALKMLGTTKTETIIFEDALHAVETAKSAGYTVAGIYEEVYKDKKTEISVIADYYIDLSERN